MKFSISPLFETRKPRHTPSSSHHFCVFKTQVLQYKTHHSTSAHITEIHPSASYLKSCRLFLFLLLLRLQSMGNNLRKKNREQDERACEKIFKVVTSPLRTNRRVSKRNQGSGSATKIRPNPETVQAKLAEASAQAAKPISKMETSGGKKKKKTVARVETVKVDERFNEYIKRAKLRIRAMTNLGDIMDADASETDTETHVPVVSASKDSGRDQFAEYIEKAKMKLQATSSLGNGNSNHDSLRHLLS
ncbi:PREDICTED: uncharacterized protein LOC104802223 [Tarenaya hassleriana]|uniref:uncharacterized protein LOC104802223 n=1 Tax=Tarenaya hassleriana TaxID=28532 RepID=UPI00053C2F04|nr:PREDICTED: uncharacterized protein LOC104802223 [Tarenaya hassleriana]